MTALVVTLPDGHQLNFAKPVSGGDVAAAIGSGLFKAALALRVDGELTDLGSVIHHDSNVQIVTAKDPAGLEILRHSTAHLLAQAVKDLFPGAQLAIGPVIEDGFYYDFSYDRPFTPEDLVKIEERMHEIAARDLPVERRDLTREEALAFFQGQGEGYKVKILDQIPVNEVISLYTQGEFSDLCRGPHVPRTGKLKVFKLTHVAGAYWRGDSSNEMLQRIYGTAWDSRRDLDAYLTRRQEAERRDHRRLGRELDLFHFQEEAAGSVFWHASGWCLYRLLEEYMRGRLTQSGYQEIKTPQLLSKRLWEQSGHWEKFRSDMFTVQAIGEPLDLAIKPMNCPGHVQVYKQGVKSYRDLPLRLAEFGACHRYEPSGALHGLLRVRAFTQDDAHIFCTEPQIEAETRSFCDLLQSIYADFGFQTVSVKFSDRPPVRAGSDEVWDRAEDALERAARSAGVDLTRNPGEGAFYGPKLEFVLRDAIGRDWQCGTLQVDFVLPERMGAEYVDENGMRQRPVMLHRAILGSFERFIGILIEHHAGKLPPWLSPVQAVVIAVTSGQSDYAQQVQSQLQSQGYRVRLDLRNETVGYKIRDNTLKRIPYLLVVGKSEQGNGEVAVRSLSGDNLGTMMVSKFAERLGQEVRMRDNFKSEE